MYLLINQFIKCKDIIRDADVHLSVIMSQFRENMRELLKLLRIIVNTLNNNVYIFYVKNKRIIKVDTQIILLHLFYFFQNSKTI